LTGYFNPSDRIASTTTTYWKNSKLRLRKIFENQLRQTLNSSKISETKEAICFMSRSTEASPPFFNKVVMASVAIERFESVIRFSKSKLQAVTAAGWVIATCKILFK
jgi:hypothetical protein